MTKLSFLGVYNYVVVQGHLKESMTTLKSCPHAVKTCSLKTVINSWSTSHRLSEARLLPSIMESVGCEDNLKHDLVWEPLWTLASSACGLPSSSLPLPLWVGCA